MPDYLQDTSLFKNAATYSINKSLRFPQWVPIVNIFYKKSPPIFNRGACIKIYVLLFYKMQNLRPGITHHAINRITACSQVAYINGDAVKAGS